MDSRNRDAGQSGTPDAVLTEKLYNELHRALAVIECPEAFELEIVTSQIRQVLAARHVPISAPVPQTNLRPYYLLEMLVNAVQASTHMVSDDVASIAVESAEFIAEWRLAAPEGERLNKQVAHRETLPAPEPAEKGLPLNESVPEPERCQMPIHTTLPVPVPCVLLKGHEGNCSMWNTTNCAPPPARKDEAVSAGASMPIAEGWTLAARKDELGTLENRIHELETDLSRTITLWKQEKHRADQALATVKHLVIDEIMTSTGPTGGWLDSPQGLCASITTKISDIMQDKQAEPLEPVAPQASPEAPATREQVESQLMKELGIGLVRSVGVEAILWYALVDARFRLSSPAKDELKQAIQILRQILADLPQKRDWLDPGVLEAQARDLAASISVSRLTSLSGRAE